FSGGLLSFSDLLTVGSLVPVRCFSSGTSLRGSSARSRDLSSLSSVRLTGGLILRSVQSPLRGFGLNDGNLVISSFGLLDVEIVLAVVGVAADVVRTFGQDQVFVVCLEDVLLDQVATVGSDGMGDVGIEFGPAFGILVRAVVTESHTALGTESGP